MNISNKLTLMRIYLIPVFLFFITTNIVKYSYTYGLIIFIVASVTDFIDGYIARKKNIITDFGKLMDPLADKMLVVSALIIFACDGLVNNIIVVIIISREFIISSIRLIAANRQQVIAADIWGKVKTVFQMLAVIAILLYKSLENVLSDNILQYIKLTGDVLIYIAVILTIISVINYIIKNYKLLKY